MIYICEKSDKFMGNNTLPVLSDTSALNYYRLPLADEIEDIRFMDTIGIPMRLKCGVYQTLSMTLTIKYWGKMKEKFSISLN